MRVTRMTVTACLLTGLMLALSAMSVGVAQAQATHFRWDIVSLSNSGPAILPGGVAYGVASDGSIIKLTGSGTFDLEVAYLVEGGGQWATYDADDNVTGQGTYTVTGLVRFDVAPGTLPAGIEDKISNPANARAGLAALEIKYNDGSQGILFISCHLEETSTSVGEGITVSKGSVLFNRVAPLPVVDANHTLFHTGF